MPAFRDRRVPDVMTRAPVTVRRETSLGETEALFAALDVSAFPVLDEDGHVVGWISKLDLLAALARDEEDAYVEWMRRPVGHVMQHAPRPVDLATPLARVAQEMIRRRVPSLPVVWDEQLVGIISREDLMRVLREAEAGGASH